jgi:WD40 repeat protein
VTLTTCQKFNEHYETITSFKAHDGLILASAFIKYKDKPTLVTGGNDNTIVIWEVRDCSEPNALAKRSNNGWYTYLAYTPLANVAVRSNVGVVEPIRRLSNCIVDAEIPCRLSKRRVLLEICLPELWRRH